MNKLNHKEKFDLILKLKQIVNKSKEDDSDFYNNVNDKGKSLNFDDKTTQLSTEENNLREKYNQLDNSFNRLNEKLLLKKEKNKKNKEKLIEMDKRFKELNIQKNSEITSKIAEIQYRDEYISIKDKFILEREEKFRKVEKNLIQEYHKILDKNEILEKELKKHSEIVNIRNSFSCKNSKEEEIDTLKRKNEILSETLKMENDLLRVQLEDKNEEIKKFKLMLEDNCNEKNSQLKEKLHLNKVYSQKIDELEKRNTILTNKEGKRYKKIYELEKKLKNLETKSKNVSLESIRSNSSSLNNHEVNNNNNNNKRKEELIEKKFKIKIQASEKKIAELERKINKKVDIITKMERKMDDLEHENKIIRKKYKVGNNIHNLSRKASSRNNDEFENDLKRSSIIIINELRKKKKNLQIVKVPTSPNLKNPENKRISQFRKKNSIQDTQFFSGKKNILHSTKITEEEVEGSKKSIFAFEKNSQIKENEIYENISENKNETSNIEISSLKNISKLLFNIKFY